MKTFHLKIVTPDGMCFDGMVSSLTLRTIHGDVGILADHVDLVTALGMGRATVITEDGTARHAACIGGMLTVTKKLVSVVATTFEFSDEIDVARAEKAKEKAQKRIEAAQSDKDMRLAELKLKRALNRINVSKM